MIISRIRSTAEQKMKKIDILKSLLPGLLPLIVFIVADSLWEEPFLVPRAGKDFAAHSLPGGTTHPRGRPCGTSLLHRCWFDNACLGLAE